MVRYAKKLQTVTDCDMTLSDTQMCRLRRPSMTLSCPDNNGVSLAYVEKQMIAQKPVLETMDAA